MNPDRKARNEALKTALRENILVLDGAMGTALQNLNLDASDYGGGEKDGCHELLCLLKPEAIQKIHEAHLKAGADIVETNTFGGTPLVLAEFGVSEKAHDINFAAAQIARAAADKFTDKPRFVAGSMGPTTKAMSVTGGIDFAGLQQNFYVQAKALWEGGSDYLLIETSQDTLNIKAALEAIRQLEEETQDTIPVAISGTIEPMGTMLAGQSIDALLASVSHRKLLYLGLNCATGPDFMTDHIRSLSEICPFPVACVPNAGLPDEDGRYLETPTMMSNALAGFIEKGWLNLMGGCCGTTVEHTRAFSQLAQGKNPRELPSLNRSILSGIEYLEIRPEQAPIIVGERTNVIGSRKFKELIIAGEFETAAEIARAQVKKGAQLIDVCLANPDRDELEDITRFLEIVVKKVKAPLVIDSTDASVIEASLKLCQGKCLINSVNLEDGEERFQTVVPLAQRFGAALVVGLIDEDAEQGMAVTRQRKIEIARRSFELLTGKYGISPYDIYWDPLVFPCGTGDKNYIGSARETIEGLRLIKKEFPQTRTILGISNVSFGLPTAGREALNSYFLYHCVKAGLDLAIVNSEKIRRFSSLSEEERTVCENLIDNQGNDPIAEFSAFYRDKKSSISKPKESMSLDERLGNYILEGSKEGLTKDLDEKLKDTPALEIINGPLMNGMDTVGRLFNENKLIVAEVLQSAEAMKAAVAHLEPHMETSETSKRGKVLLATVKGDVHDIGKNLVEIILTNNGFEIINLGIKVPPEKIIAAIQQHSPDIVGLSGLLVKSAQQMLATAEDFTKAGIKTPILVGGAALSKNYVDRRIAKAYTTGTVAYAQDAMNGLDLAKQIIDPASFEKLKKELETARAKLAENTPSTPVLKREIRTERSEEVELLTSIPNAPDFENHVLNAKTPIDQILKYVNPMMIYGRHLGIRGKTVKLIEKALIDPSLKRQVEKEDPKGFEIWEATETVKAKYRETAYLRPRAIYQFFRVHSEGNSLFVHDTAGKTLAKIDFPRMDKRPFHCLADLVSPKLSDNDNVAFFAMTVGEDVRTEAERLKQAGDYLSSHILQVLALESAEAYAEWMHAQIRRMWGFADKPEMTMLERFQAKYHGKRYSFGYPACPDLSGQKTLFDLLDPSKIGIQLTEEFMMDPEASVSAMVFHHPQAAYFSVGIGALGDD